MMKQFPYAASLHHMIGTSDYEVPMDYADNTIAHITRITHDSPISQLTAVMHNKTLMYLLATTPETLDMKLHLEHLAYIAPIHERLA
jgi:hypothetical protein